MLRSFRKKNLVGAFSEYCVPRNFVGTFSSWAPVCPHPAGASSGLRLRVAFTSASLAVASIECVRGARCDGASRGALHPVTYVILSDTVIALITIPSVSQAATNHLLGIVTTVSPLTITTTTTQHHSSLLLRLTHGIMGSPEPN